MSKHFDHPQRPSINKLNADVRLKFDAALLQQVAPFIASNDFRYYLNGLHVERAADKEKGVYLVATNGHRMVVVYDPTGEISGDHGRGVIMRVTPQMVKAGRERLRPPKMMVVATGLRVSVAPDFDMEHSELEAYVLPGAPWIDGTFPDFRRVLPVFADLKYGMASQINPDYLLDLDKIAPKKYPGINFWHSEPTGAVVVQILGLPNFLALIMPMRGDDLDVMRRGMRPVLDAKPVVAAEGGGA